MSKHESCESTRIYLIFFILMSIIHCISAVPRALCFVASYQRNVWKQLKSFTNCFRCFAAVSSPGFSFSLRLALLCTARKCCALEPRGLGRALAHFNDAGLLDS